MKKYVADKLARITLYWIW